MIGVRRQHDGAFKARVALETVKREKTVAQIATAILDGILHHSTTVNIKGNSYRLKEKVKAGRIREPEVEENEHGG